MICVRKGDLRGPQKLVFHDGVSYEGCHSIVKVMIQKQQTAIVFLNSLLARTYKCVNYVELSVVSSVNKNLVV